MSQFGTFQFNTIQFDGAPSETTVYSTNVVVFDGFSLSDNSSLYLMKVGEPEPKKDILSGNVPRGDGSYVIGNYLRDKVIPVKCLLKKSTAALFDQYIDTIKQNLRGFQKNLDVTRLSDGAVRRYIATLQNGETLFDRSAWNLTAMELDFSFVVKDGLGYGRDYTSVSAAVTSSPTTLVYENMGTYKSKPVVTLIFDSASSVTVINVNNTTTAEQIQYSGAISAGDVLVFDGEQETVTKNGTAVDYSGGFPFVDVGSNNVRFTITGTSFNAYCTIKAKYAYK